MAKPVVSMGIAMGFAMRCRNFLRTSALEFAHVDVPTL